MHIRYASETSGFFFRALQIFNIFTVYIVKIGFRVWFCYHNKLLHKKRKRIAPLPPAIAFSLHFAVVSTDN